MKYAFNDFVFDSDQLILYKNNEVVACRHNEARLLALFLSEPQRVFSKEEILERVWAGKVVSEQAVFQNISLLRSLFGEGAIKTFSKKGYQWQLDVNPYIEVEQGSLIPGADSWGGNRSEENASQENTAEASIVAGGNTRKNQPAIRIAASAALLLIVLITVWYWRPLQGDPVLTSIALLPLVVEPNDEHNPNIDNDLIQPLQAAINQTKVFSPVAVSGINNYRDFPYTPQKYFDQIARATSSEVVMMAMVGERNDKVSIRYTLKSELGGWVARHEAATVALLMEQLNAHMALLLQSKLLTIDAADANLMNAQLKIVHQQAPEDLVILAQLATSEIRSGNTHNGILLSDELRAKAKAKSNMAAEGDGYVIAAEAYIDQMLYTEAIASLQKAVTLYDAEQNYAGLISVQQAYSRMAFAQHDYASFKKSLVAAMHFAKQAQDPLIEVDMSVYLSVVANKFDEKHDRQFYLDYAELVLDETRQSREQYGGIYFYEGMYAETDALAEKNYRKVLLVLPADQDWWERERALEHLSSLLIKQARWQEAQDLFADDHPRKPFEELIITRIYSAQKMWEQAEAHGLAAFKMANLSGQKELALDAALALLTIYDADDQLEKGNIYRQFIQKAAEGFPYWIKVNQPAIEKLAITLAH